MAEYAVEPATEKAVDLDQPKIFISYRWSSPEHEAWVLQFATTLRTDGIDVILDKWHLEEGQDTLAFMEQMVGDNSIGKVLLICDEAYVERANSRKGGVGTEAQIVSASVYKETDQNKFAAVVTELNAEGIPFLPHYMETRLYFDMSSPDAEVINYDKILRWVFGKPFHALPPIGKTPKFLEKTYTSGTSILRTGRTANMLNNDTGLAISRAAEILDMVASDAPSFIVNLSGKPNPENLTYEGMKATFPVLENTYSAFTELIQQGTEKAADTVHGFFERILEQWEYAPLGKQYTDLDNDALRFFGHSALVSFVALAMRERSFKFAADVLSTPFFKPNRNEKTGKSATYTAFATSLRSLETRNSILKLNRLSLHADLLAEHYEHSAIPFINFLEADLTLFLRGLGTSNYRWYPVSSVYLGDAYGSLPTFARATSNKFYQRLKPLLLDKNADQLRRVVAESKQEIPRTSFREIELTELANLEQLATSV